VTAPSGSARQLGAWLAFGPLVAVAALRWVLAWWQGRAGDAPAWPLAPFVGTQDPFAWLHTAAAVLAALALLVLLGWAVRRRLGLRALWRLLAGLWVAAALAACTAQIMQFTNLRGLVAQPQPLPARVLGSRQIAPSARGPGGTLLVLQLPGEPTQQVLIDDPAAAQLATGQPLALAWATGRWRGRYVTGWQRAGGLPQAQGQ